MISGLTSALTAPAPRTPRIRGFRNADVLIPTGGAFRVQSRGSAGVAALADVLSVAASGAVVIGSSTLNNGNGSVLYLSNSGFQQTASNMVDVQIAGSARMRLDGSVSVWGTSVYGWVASTSLGTNDTMIGRQAAANLRQGAADSNAPVPQTLSVQSVAATNTDTAGADWTMVGSLSTGAGRGGAWMLKTSQSEAGATTQNSATTRTYVAAKWVNLTESTATTFANIALAASKMLGAKLTCTVYAADAVDFQALTTEVTIQAVNKAGVVTATVTAVGSTTAASAGTLTATYTVVASGNSVNILCSAVSSLTQTTLRIMWQIVALNSNDIGTVTAT